MVSLWNKFQAWLKSKNITTKAIGYGVVAFCFAYNGSPELRNYIGTVFVGYPVVVTKLGILVANIVAGVTLWRNFAHSSSPAGVLAKAQNLALSPNPPTQAAIDAANPSTK